MGHSVPFRHTPSLQLKKLKGTALGGVYTKLFSTIEKIIITKCPVFT